MSSEDQLQNISLSYLDNQPGININDQLFLFVDKAKGKWGFKLYCSYTNEPLTSWVLAKNPPELRRPRKYKILREPIAREVGEDRIDEAIERILILIEQNLREFEKERKPKGKEEKPQYDSDTLETARELLLDPAFFYKLGKVLEWGAVVPKIKKPRFVIGEERNKRLVGPLLIGASELNMTSIVKILGDIGTAKDSMLRLWIELLSSAIKTIERSYITAAALRYSQDVGEADLLYIPDSPYMKGEKGRHLRFMRADDGGLISEYAMKDPETGEMTAKTVTLPIKGVATTSNAVTGDAALESGMWTLETNSSEDLTHLVKEEKLKLRAGKRGLFPERELKVWKAAFHIMLTEDQMTEMPLIPYAESLIKILESTRSDSRRDPDKLCDLISLVAWMRRFQKPFEKWRSADLVDLYIAFQIGLDAITQTVSELSEKEFSIFNALAELGSATVREVSDKTSIPYKTCYNYLEYQLLAKGYITKDKRKGQNIYHVSMQKNPKTLLISEGRTFDKAEDLMGFILRSFDTFSLSRDSTEYTIIDPLTATKLTLTLNEEGPIIETEESPGEIVNYPYPHEKGRTFISSPKQSSSGQETPEELLPSEKGRGKQIFSLEQIAGLEFTKQKYKGWCAYCGEKTIIVAVAKSFDRKRRFLCEECRRRVVDVLDGRENG